MNEELLVEVLCTIPVGHVRLVTSGAVEMFDSLLPDDHCEVTFETAFAHGVSAARHSDSL